jgi:hypothetical protein
MVEIKLLESTLLAIQVHSSTRVVLLVLSVLGSITENQEYQKMILEGLVSVEYFYRGANTPVLCSLYRILSGEGASAASKDTKKCLRLKRRTANPLYLVSMDSARI